MTTNTLVRLSREIILGSHIEQVEFIADMIGMSMSDMFNFALMLADAELAGDVPLDDEDIIDAVFMGRKEGYVVIRIIREQLPDVLSHFPKDVQEIRYLRTYGDAIYAIGRSPVDLSS